MENSKLAKLSPELRNKIYDLVLIHPEPIELGEGSKYMSLTRRGYSHLIALMHSCKQMQHECEPIFYSAKAFSIPYTTLEETLGTFRSFRNLIGPESSKALSKVIFEGQVGNACSCLHKVSGMEVESLTSRRSTWEKIMPWYFDVDSDGSCFLFHLAQEFDITPFCSIIVREWSLRHKYEVDPPTKEACLIRLDSSASALLVMSEQIDPDGTLANISKFMKGGAVRRM